MIISFSFRRVLMILIFFTILTLLIAPLIGTDKLSILELLSSRTGKQIFFELRLPRIMFSFLVGFSLALIGVSFQALLQNELATPYTLGVASGGALGAVIAIKSGLEFSLFGFTTITFCSVGGSVLTILIIYLIAKSRAGLSPLTLILTGVTVSLLFSSLILFVHYLADFTETYRMIHWLMGSLQVTGWSNSLILIPFAPWRPLINVKDMARAIEWAISREVTDGGDFLAVNVGSSEWNYQVKDLAEAVAKVMPEVDISINKNAQPDKRSYRVNFDLFQKLAPDHQPQVDLITTIRELKTGLETIAFNDKDFRESKYMRLKVLTQLQENGRLNGKLQWIKTA